MRPRLVGTAKDVADQMAEIVTSGAADGLVVSPAFLPDTFEDFVAEVVPILGQEIIPDRIRGRDAPGSPRPVRRTGMKRGSLDGLIVRQTA